MMISPRHRLLLHQLWSRGPASRWELHEQTQIRPNTVGADTTALIAAGLLREGASVIRTKGRPRVPLELDTDRRHTLGLAVLPGHIEAQRVNLLGHPVDKPVKRSFTDTKRTSASASLALKDLIDDNTLAVGVTVPGSFDRQQNQLLVGSGRTARETSLAGLLNTAEAHTTVISTPLHARAAHWLLEQKADVSQDVMFIDLADGRIEAAMLGGSRPRRSRIATNAPLGQMRLTHAPAGSRSAKANHASLDLQTLFSSDHLANAGRRKGTLTERLAVMDNNDVALHQVLDSVSTGLANAVNFAQPEKVVFIGLAGRHAGAFDAITTRLQKQTLPAIGRNLSFASWDPPSITPAHLSAWLALAEIYIGEWAS